MRKVIALALCVALQAAGLTGPLVHAHPDDHLTDHHSGAAVHAHWSSHTESHHPSDHPAVGATDYDRAVFLNAFVAVAASVFPNPAETPNAIEAPVPEERAAHRVLEIATGHDPPYSRSRPSRAPPAFLS